MEIKINKNKFKVVLRGFISIFYKYKQTKTKMTKSCRNKCAFLEWKSE